MQDTGQAQEKAREVAGQAQEKAQEAAQQAKSRVSEQVDQRSTEAGRQIGSVASDVRTVADELRNQGKEKPAEYAEQAAQRVERAGQWLEQKNGDELLRDVEDFARRNPWAVATGGLLLGLAASRMLKASSSRRYRSSTSNGSGSYGSASYGGTLEAQTMPSGAPTHGGRFERDDETVGTSTGMRTAAGEDELRRPEGSMISSEPRT